MGSSRHLKSGTRSLILSCLIMNTKEHLLISVYIQNFANNDFIILFLYVDDMLVAGKDKSKIDRLKKELSKSFDMTGLGPIQYILE